MGAKTCMLVYAENNAREALAATPQLNREASQKLAETLFPGQKLEPLADGNLLSTYTPGPEIYIGCFSGVSVVAAKEFGIDYPSKVPSSFIAAGGSGTIYLHAMHSVVDWFAYAVWVNGTLQRSLSVAPDNGAIEDIGQRLPFEEPYWAGRHPAGGGDDGGDEYPLPFHPLELGEAALRALFGYELEGLVEPDRTLISPESVSLLGFKRVRSKWRFWR